MRVILFAIYFCALVISLEGKEDEVEDHLGFATPYRVNSYKHYEKIKYEGCEPRKIWMYIKHGTRNPGKKSIEKVKERLPELKELILKDEGLKARLTRSDLELLRKWKTSNLKTRDEEKLVKEGKSEMTHLAERMKVRFPHVFDNEFTNETYKMKASPTQATIMSGVMFGKGLFGKDEKIWVPKSEEFDPIVRFYTTCNKSLNAMKNNETLKEYYPFLSSDLVKNSIKRMSKRLGLNESELSYDDIHAMYDGCRYEIARNSRHASAWCKVLDLETIKVLEYDEDLKYYYSKGYGNQINYKQACGPLNDLVATFENVNVNPKSTIYFVQSPALLKFSTRLGLHKDEKALSYEKIDEKRNWRLSKIDSFGSNLAFVSYKCGNDDKVLMMFQEKVKRLPACPDNDLCALKDIKNFYADSLNSCNLDTICENKV